MAEYSADEILGKTGPSKQAPVTYSADEIFAASMRQSQDLAEQAPKFSGKSKGAGFGTLVEAGLVDDPATQVGIYARARGIPQEEIPKRFTYQAGKVYFKGDDGVFRPESPSGIGGFAKQMGADIISHGPSVALSTAGGILGAAGGSVLGTPVAGGPAGAVAGAGVGGAAGEGYRKLLGNLFYDEPQTLAGNIKSMGVEGLTAAGGEYLGILGGRAYGAIANRRAIRDLNKLNQAAVDNLTRLAEREGIQLTPAELTGLSSLIRQQWLLGNLPDSSDVIHSFLKNREPQIQQAVYGFFNKLSSEATPFMGYRQGIRSAKTAKDNLIEIRKQASEKFYREAFKENPKIDTSDMLSWINARSADASAPQLKTLNWLRKEFDVPPVTTKVGGGKAHVGYEEVRGGTATTKVGGGKVYAGQEETGRTFINKQGLLEKETVPRFVSTPEKTITYTPASVKTVPKLVDVPERTITYQPAAKFKSLLKFHNVKLSIDKKLSALQERTLSADKVDERILSEFKGMMLEKMRDKSPQYAAGLDKFKELSAPINKLDDSLVGGFVKYDDEQAMSLATQIFGSKSSPEAISEARQIISSVDPNSWDSVVRAYMQDAFERVRDNVADQTTNIGGVFRKTIFGSPRQREMLRASMSQQQFGALNDLMMVLNATGKSFKGQSITVPAGYAARELEEDAYATGAGLIKRGIDVIDVASAPGRIRKFYEGYLQGKYNQRMAEIITDKNAMERLRKETMKMRDTGGKTSEILPHLTRAIAVIMGPEAEQE